MPRSARPSRRPTSAATAVLPDRRRLTLGLLAIVLAVAPVVLASPASAQGGFTETRVVIDEDGANDKPGQRDLTRHAIDETTLTDDPSVLGVRWNFDEIALSGNNTGDACALFDTDGDGRANGALCVTVAGDPLELSATDGVRAFTCDDATVDRCTGSVPIADFASTCEVEQTNTDPFPADPPLVPAGDAYPQDTTVTCSAVLLDFDDTPDNVDLINTCSYTSTVPNSSPADCVLVPRDAFLIIEKDARPDTSQEFSFLVDGDPIAEPLEGGESSAIIPIRSDQNHTVEEQVPAGWALDSATCTGAAGSNGTATATGRTGIDPSPGNTVRCVFVNSNKAPTITVAKTPTPPTVPSGGATVRFDVVVQNTSSPAEDVTLTDLDDDDYGDLLDPLNTAVSDNDCDEQALAITGGGSFTCSFTLFIDSSHSNTVTARVVDAGGLPATNEDTAVVNLNTAPTISVTKTPDSGFADADTVPAGGGDVDFEVVVTNTSAVDVTLTSLTDSDFDPLTAPGDCATGGTILANGGTYTCTFTGFVNPAVSDPHVNTVTAIVTDGIENGQDTGSATVSFNTAPTISVTKTPDSGEADPATVPAAGGDVEFTVVVTNDGAADVTLTDLSDSIFDPLTAPGDCVTGGTILANGGTYTCTFTGAVDPAAGNPHVNTVEATVEDVYGDEDVEDADATVSFNTAPTISVTKTPDSGEADPATVPAAGGDVEFTVVVTNDGAADVTLTDLSDSIFDPLTAPGDCVTGGTILANGGTYTCTFTGAVDPAAGNPHVNTVEATVEDVYGDEDVEDADATVSFNTAPTISVTKTPDSGEADPATVPAAGGDVEFTVVVTNDGAADVTLTDLSDSIFDPLTAPGDCVTGGTILANGGTYTCTFTGAVDPAAGNPHVNTVEATVEDVYGDEDVEDADATVSFNTAPTISVTKTPDSGEADPATVPAAGGDVEFTVVVTNDGAADVTLTDLSDSIFDPLTAPGDCVTGGTILANGGTYTCTFTGAVDPAAGNPHVNTVEATVEDVYGDEDVEDADATVSFNTAPTISVTKTPDSGEADPATVPAAGGDVEFTVVVTNDGAADVTLTDLSDSIFDPLTAPGDCVTGGTILANGGTYTCTFTGAVDPAAGNPHVNTVEATVEDVYGDEDVEDADATVSFNTAPTISVTKDASPNSLPATGGQVTFSVTVTGTDGDGDTLTLDSLTDTEFGNLLTNTALTDNTCLTMAGAPLPVTCSFKATITADHSNTVTAVGTDGFDDDDASDDATVDVRPAILIDVDKQADLTEVPTAGGDVTYTVVVTNDSTVDVTISELYDTINGVDTDLLDPGNELEGNTCNDGASLTILANGGTFTCTFTLFVSGAPGSVHTDEVTAVAGVGPDSDTAVSPSVDVTVKRPPPPPPPPPAGPSADLSVTKSVDPAEIDQGLTATFTIVVANDGPDSASTVTLTDPVPEGLEITDVSTTAGTCTTDGQDITCTLGTLAATTSATITIEVTGVEPGLYTNAATADSATADPDSDNDTGSTDLVVIETDVEGECVVQIGGITGIQGPTRIETAIEASQAIFCDQEALAVVLTRSDLFPDAQAGTPLAIDKDAPMLLSEPASLNPMTETEIVRVLQPGGTVYLLGGTAALSQAVEDRIVELGFTAIRLGGLNRFGTAAVIADEGLDNPATLLAANGGDFPDSVMAGAASLTAGQGEMAAVILTSGADVPPETAAYLAGRTDSPTVIAIGGPAAQAFPDVEGIVGPSRFDTSVAVAERFFTDPVVVGLATGIDFADALTGGAVIGRDDIGPGPMLLTNPDQLPPVVGDYLADNTDSITGVAIFGGTAAISDGVRDEVAAIFGFENP